MFHFLKNNEKIIFILTVIICVNTVSCDTSEITRNSTACEKLYESEFPEDLFTKKQKKLGAILLHVVLFLYAFGAIAVVCEEYFLPTIRCICEDLKLSDDVAAATFMSIATATPELFTNIIGTFITESDIGLGHVIGNGYFDMFFVASLGGLVAKPDIVLDWWPLARDCSIYFLVALTLTGVVWDGVVQTYETLILLTLYVIYFFIMFNNSKIIDFLSKKFKIEINTPQITNNSNEPSPRISRANTTSLDGKGEKDDKAEPEEIEPFDTEQSFTLPPPPTTPTTKSKNKYWILTKKVFIVPLRIFTSYTIPDVRLPVRRKYYPIAFVLCIAWIGVATYLGTWMISVIGETLGIPDLVMGMVFMAAGGSVVEAYSVYYKAKRGECSIGLSNSMGCNNLDATLCLALPWFIKTLLPASLFSCPESGSAIKLESPYIHINCLLLVISVLGLFYIFYSNKFKLNKRSGLICGVIYVLVLIIAISIESYDNE